MAEIDKSLPGEIRTEIKVPGEEVTEQVDIEEQVPEKGPVLKLYPKKTVVRPLTLNQVQLIFLEQNHTLII